VVYQRGESDVSGIALSSAVGAGSRVDISAGGAVEDVEAAPSTALARIDFESDGDITAITSVGSVDAGDWLSPKSAAPGAYQIMAHQNSGDAVTGSLDTWLALTSTRSWSLEQLVAGAVAANLTISIGIGGVALSSGTFTLEAEVL
jgi:hypothetical protein